MRLRTCYLRFDLVHSTLRKLTNGCYHAEKSDPLYSQPSKPSDDQFQCLICDTPSEIHRSEVLHICQMYG